MTNRSVTSKDPHNIITKLTWPCPLYFYILSETASIVYLAVLKVLSQVYDVRVL